MKIRKRLFLIGCFMLCGILLSGQENQPLSRLIDSLKINDQKWRNLAVKARNHELDTISLDQVTRKLIEVDSMNFTIISDLFRNYGYLGYDKVGQQSSHNFWLLVQHADKHPEFQDSVLVKMKVEAEQGNSSLKDYAYLLDRVKVNTGSAQVYGTQMRLNADSTSFEPKEVIEPNKLNERRTQVGLSPIEEYIRIMNESFLRKKNK